LQQHGFGQDARLDAFFAQVFGDVAQEQGFRDVAAGFADFLGDVLVGVVELLGETMQAVGFLEGRQVFALDVFDERNFQRFGIIGHFFDARNFAEACGTRSVVAAFARDDVVAVFAGDETHQERLEDTLFADGLGEFAEVTEGLARLVGVGTNLFDRDHPADGGAAITC
jgi:hypothetical protein